MTAPGTIQIRLLMFGGLASTTGAGEQALEIEEGMTAGQVVALVARTWPEAAPILERVSVAVNLETVPHDHPIADGDEVALLPPVAGGAGARITSGVRTEAISIDEVMDLVADPRAGGTVVFVGTVRDHSEGWEGVQQLDYSVYRDMAEPLLARIAGEAAERWPLNGMCILHRVGTLPVGEQTVVVAASAPHRGEAFEAARYGIDEVKRRVPVWKLEIGPNGERWIGIDSPAEGGPSPVVAS
ncbi:MAG TPA: molybdenum cofactor biosynthesis protein MoaE [Actinomycetota bacterium]|nr:molybdenum cofactor biosynthesis protein MoaE [Actinomycetota bacterium]